MARRFLERNLSVDGNEMVPDNVIPSAIQQTNRDYESGSRNFDPHLYWP